ncbi:polysaccharide ABC transporter ATP-binding protein [Altericista sp. CCNU0014]|uniref:ABC transporter ATP-binding protein n=1 Tax=Altericista sp. CCNU0014 TaxID=3082949 RepID=UPI00384C5E48
MTDTVIHVENLSKKYVLNHQQQERYTALRDVIANGVKSLGSRFLSSKDAVDPSHEEFWALKDVSFEIKQGDRVGIIGRNGAGKSTLLKILSRITEPTEGRIKIKGRVASLLEVGTGFHPELTGRENIFLNGAILGMEKEEIKRKFDEIVAFAEVERFLDTPVKRYSSGMYVRLAFAVAAHLEPEILIVDEVLAVGDAQFQKKCLGKMEDISKGEGRTILFVSHNMDAIRALCTNGILLSKGAMICQANIDSTIALYSNLSSEMNLDKIQNLELSERLLVKEFGYHLQQDNLEINLRIQNREDRFSILSIALLIYTVTGIRIALIDLSPKEAKISVCKDEIVKFNCIIHNLNLVAGDYKIGFAIETSDGWIDRYQLVDLIIENDINPLNEFHRFPASIRGFLNPCYNFTQTIISATTAA